MKVKIVKRVKKGVMACDVSPVAMFNVLLNWFVFIFVQLNQDLFSGVLRTLMLGVRETVILGVRVDLELMGFSSVADFLLCR